MKRFKFISFAVGIIIVFFIPKFVTYSIKNVRWHNSNHYPQSKDLVIIEIDDYYMFINPENNSVDGMPKNEWDRKAKNICFYCRYDRHPLTKLFKKLNIIKQTEDFEERVFHAHHYGNFHSRSENRNTAINCCLYH